MPDNSETHKPELIEEVRRVLRGKHYSLRTEEAYVDWVRRFISWHVGRLTDRATFSGRMTCSRNAAGKAFATGC